jgi:L-alanine-DL-glutamate epimerase-like enolase superfamily enzyme
MKVTAVHVDTLELVYDEPFVIASSALTAGPFAPRARGLTAEVRDGASMVVIPGGPGLGIELDDEAVAARRVERPWRKGSAREARQEV